ncbi:hypothetical protein MTO96_021232 [Rhipicephalus appendiculatus]
MRDQRKCALSSRPDDEVLPKSKRDKLGGALSDLSAGADTRPGGRRRAPGRPAESSESARSVRYGRGERDAGRAASGRAFRLQSPNLRLTDGALHTPAQGVSACAESGARLLSRSFSLVGKPRRQQTRLAVRAARPGLPARWQSQQNARAVDAKWNGCDSPSR